MVMIHYLCLSCVWYRT